MFVQAKRAGYVGRGLIDAMTGVSPFRRPPGPSLTVDPPGGRVKQTPCQAGFGSSSSQAWCCCSFSSCGRPRRDAKNSRNESFVKQSACASRLSDPLQAQSRPRRVRSEPGNKVVSNRRRPSGCDARPSCGKHAPKSSARSQRRRHSGLASSEPLLRGPRVKLTMLIRTLSHWATISKSRKSWLATRSGLKINDRSLCPRMLPGSERTRRPPNGASAGSGEPTGCFLKILPPLHAPGRPRP